MQNKIPRPLWYVNVVVDDNDNFVAYEVQEHTCIREGVLEGCSLPTITTRDPLGRVANSSLDMFHETEEDAWDTIKMDVASEIMDLESEIEYLQKHLLALNKYQESLQ